MLRSRPVGVLLLAGSVAAQVLPPGSTRWSPDRFIEYVVGNAPIVISAGHGGSLEPPSIPDRTYGTFAKDTRTIELAREFAEALAQRFSLRPHLVLCHLHRRKVDVNRDVVEGAQGDPLAIAAWNAFHAAIADARNAVQGAWGTGLYLDLHGHGHPEGWIELGYLLSGGELALADSVLAQPGYVASSSIRSVGSLPGVWFPEVLRGPTSLGGHLQSGGYDSVPSPVNPHPAGGNYFSGGHNAAAYGSRGGGAIDGIQVETPWSVRSSLPVRTPFLARMGGWVESFFPTYRTLDLRQGARLTIAASDRVASESGGRAQLVLRRTGSTALPRIVLLHCDGTATAGADYVHPGAFATFGVGEAEVRLEIRALDDALVEGDETVRVWLVGSNDIGVPGCAEVVLFDDEPTNDVALHLPLDLAAATTPDASGNGRHGTLLPLGAGPLAVPGRVGGALQFDGVDDRVRLADFAYAPAGEFSVAFWFRTNSTAGTGFRYLLSHGGVATPHRLGVYFDQATGHLRTALLYANDLTGLDVLDITRDLRDGQWHHYALVARRDDLVRVYIDGVETAAAMFLGDQFDPVGDLVLGSRSDLGAGTLAAAALDDVQMARRPWSAVEVHRLHAAAPREAMVYPGTGEDLLLATGIDAAPTSGPRRDVKAAAGGSTLVAHYSSPGGAFSGRFAALAVDVFATGSPSVHPGFAGVHLAVPHVVHGPLPLGPLPASWTFPVPSGFAGVSLMLQPIALDPAAANGLFAAGDAHEIRLH